MPELPEVEVVRRGLEAHIVGRTIREVEVRHPRPVRSHPDPMTGFGADLIDRTIGAPRRRGKYLWLPLDDTDALLVHLGMSGQFRINRRGDEEIRHTRVVFHLDDGTQLRFVDQRMFGGLQYCPEGAELPDPVRHVALDPFDPRFDSRAVAARIRGRRSTIKRVLLDQTVLSGVGNIYADEALWRSRVHPQEPTQTLSVQRVGRVLDSVRDVMAEALTAGGISFDSLYVNVEGTQGYFGRRLSVYGRENQPCDRCGAPIVREPFMNRSSHRCPRCQRRPRGGSHV